MEKLIAGVRAFHIQMKGGGSATYEPLAEGQQPDTLFVACADSRVVPAFLSSSEPGSLFTVRNVGNLIPPADARGASLGDRSEASAIEYAVDTLGVTDIVICGHSGCGAMGALEADKAKPLPVNLDRWLELARPTFDATQFPASLGEGLARADTLSQRNVVVQLRALRTYPNVAAAMASGRLRLHGWWFDIRNTRVDAYDAEGGRFVDFDQAYAVATH